MPERRAFSVLACLGLALAGTGAARAADQPQVFRHRVETASRPWTHEAFDHRAERVVFAVFSDLTGGEREGVFDIAMAQLNLLRPELIISVGDLIEGDGDEAAVNAQWAAFDARAAVARAPVFRVGGNHDLTSPMLQETWDKRHGRRYYHFVYRDVLFLVLDTEDHTPERTREIHRLLEQAQVVANTQGWDAFDETEYARLPENDGGNISREQSAYFRKVIGDHPDVMWTFLFLHKAPWEREDPSTFVAIEEALGERPYTVFHGHKHAYRHLRRRGRDYIRLATTGGVPLPQHGRSMDQVVLVTVDRDGVDIANLALSGILDRSGRVPLDGDQVCFESAVCGSDP